MNFKDTNLDDKNKNKNKHEDKDVEIVFPGYYPTCVNESGVRHSQLKLHHSAGKLFSRLYRCHRQEEEEEEENFSNTSQNGYINDDEKDRRIIDIQTFPCLNEEDTWTYRCRCSFQIVQIPTTMIKTTTTTNKSTTSEMDDDNKNSVNNKNCISSSFYYAIRSKGQPVILGTRNSFPIATRRIQTAMKEFMDHIKDKNNTINVVNNKHLTSCTFSSAWNDIPDADCILTLNYGHPLEGDKITWKEEAQVLCRKLRLRQINGRSKGTLLSVKKGGGNSFESVNE